MFDWKMEQSLHREVVHRRSLCNFTGNDRGRETSKAARTHRVGALPRTRVVNSTERVPTVGGWIDLTSAMRGGLGGIARNLAWGSPLKKAM